MNTLGSHFLHDFTTESTLASLPRWTLTLSDETMIELAVEYLDQDSRLPGLLVHRKSGFFEMIPRERLSTLFFPIGRTGKFAQMTLGTWLGLREDPVIALEETTTIHQAVAACLQRPPTRRYECFMVVSAVHPPAMIDFHDLLQAQHHLITLTREMAERASTEKDNYFAVFSHELQTPLTAMLGYVEMIKDDVEVEKLKETYEFLEKIEACGRDLVELIDGVLHFSKNQGDRMDLQLGTINLHDLINEIQSVVSPLARKNFNNFQVFSPLCLGTIQGDESKLRRSLLNLLSNACKFTANGIVSLSVQPEPSFIIFKVSDTGIGIPKTQLSRIFDPFFQADASIGRQYGGTGLGLAITQHFCQLMGGNIQVQSELGLGTTFELCLPTQPSKGREPFFRRSLHHEQPRARSL